MAEFLGDNPKQKGYRNACINGNERKLVEEWMSRTNSPTDYYFLIYLKRLAFAYQIGELSHASPNKSMKIMHLYSLLFLDQEIKNMIAAFSFLDSFFLLSRHPWLLDWLFGWFDYLLILLSNILYYQKKNLAYNWTIYFH